MLTLFGILSGILPALAGYPYIRDIFRHQTKPHRASFLIWTVLGGIAFFSQLAEGATWSLWLTGVDTAVVVIIFTLSLGYGSSGYTKRDIAALILAGCSLVLWYFTQQPVTALLIIIGIDAIGTTLTIIKAHEQPHTETFSSWLLSSLGGLFAMLAVGALSFDLLAYPAYVFMANGAIDVAIILGKRRLRQFPDKQL